MIRGRGGGDDALGTGDVHRGHVELRAEAVFEQAVLHPPGNVLERRAAGRDHLARQRPLGELDGDAGGLAERDDLGGDALRAELGHQPLRADQPRPRTGRPASSPDGGAWCATGRRQARSRPTC